MRGRKHLNSELLEGREKGKATQEQKEVEKQIGIAKEKQRGVEIYKRRESLVIYLPKHFSPLPGATLK
jgi:hypothetical protein